MNAEKMKYRNIRQFKLSAIGYGAMGLSHGYGACPEHKESIRLLKKTFESGCNFIDTAEAYGLGENERLVGEAYEGVRDKVIIATKLHLIGESDNWAKYNNLFIIVLIIFVYSGLIILKTIWMLL